jgi:hypothetical protein
MATIVSFVTITIPANHTSIDFRLGTLIDDINAHYSVLI